jgi:threonine/homoserine/homoserine lactone efflux protein
MLLKGMAIGLAIAAPVGPIGLLCIRRSIEQGRAAGLATGLGAASADAVYGAIAAFGLTAVSSALVAGQFWLQLGGGLFLGYLGVRTMLAEPATQPGQSAAGGLFRAYAATVVLTLTNPLTIMSFAAVFAGLGLKAGAGPGGALGVVSGVFLGSALWWLLLSGGAALLRARMELRHLRWLNRLSGLILLAFACYTLAALYRS